MRTKIIIGSVFISIVIIILGLIIDPHITFSVLGFIVMLILIYLGSCFRTVSAEKAGFKVFLEKPKDKIYSGGFLFVFWPLEKLVVWPKQQQHIDLPVQEIISARKVLRRKNLVGVNDNQQDSIYSQAVVKVDPVFYFRWPTDNSDEDGNNDIYKLIKSYRNSPGPDNATELEKFFGDFVTSIIRYCLGRISWLETRQGEIENEDGSLISLSDFVIEKLKEGGDNNPIIQAGLEDFRVEFKSIKLPEELEKAITAPQVAEYDATATRKKADAEAYKRTKEGEGDAAARKVIFKAIEEAGDNGIQMETLHTLRRMAQGTSNTILYGLPPKVANVLSGDYTPDEKELAVFAKLFVEYMEKKGFMMSK